MVTLYSVQKRTSNYPSWLTLRETTDRAEAYNLAAERMAQPIVPTTDTLTPFTVEYRVDARVV